MTEYHITVGKALLPELLSNQNGLAKFFDFGLQSLESPRFLSSKNRVPQKS